MRRRRLSVWIGVWIAGSCHANQPASTPSALDVEAKLSRQRIAADGVRVRATLWNPALVAATPPGRSSPQSSLERERQQLTERYLSHTSFTVAIDIADRAPVLGKKDTALTDPKTWSFVLDRDTRTGLQPNEVRLIGIDRYPTQTDRAHQRLVFRVHFDGPFETSPTAARPMVLWVRNTAPLAWRPALGGRVANRGIPLRWTIGESE